MFRPVCALAALFVCLPLTAADKLKYNRDVRPILSENCFACHGPDSAARKADLRLDRPKDALDAGAIVPGKVDASEAVVRIFSKDPNEMMPTPKSHKTLTDAQKEILKRWIAEGAEYEPHWSFVPVTRPEPPKVQNEAWVKNPIDRFVLSKLEKAGLKPAPEADRNTLARRASLDIIGLPPTPAQVAEFVNDKSPDAYEKYIKRLMDSPRWGEHRGRYWLDAARYADTHGIHFDNFREMWSYREWVIKALNKNMPFDQFTVEQLAGDLLPNRTVEQQVASGFNRCNITTNEGGAIADEYLVLYDRDRTETTSAVWLGLTTGCAVCHDHKFDPISQKEFYQLAAFFNNTTQGAMDGNIPNTPPTIMLPNPENVARVEELKKLITEAKAAAEARKKPARAEFDAWYKAIKLEELLKKLPSDKLHLLAPLQEGQGNTVTVQVDGKPVEAKAAGLQWEAGHTGGKSFSAEPQNVITLPTVGDFDTNQAFSVSSWVRPNRKDESGAFFSRMDEGNDYRGWDLWHEGGRLGIHVINKWPTSGVKVLSKKLLPAQKWSHVTATYDGSGKASGVKLFINGQPEPFDIMSDNLVGTIKTPTPFRLAQRSAASKMVRLGLENLRIYTKVLTPQEVGSLAGQSTASRVLAIPAAKRTPKDVEALFGWWAESFDTVSIELVGKVAKLEQELTTLSKQGTVAHVMQEKPGEAMAYLLFRGDYDKRRDQVKANVPAVLPPLGKDLPQNRLGLAKWIVDPANPLPARVTVNRFWQELFGTGLVKTAGDFGTTGEAPSHPELLDWLASEFVAKKWDMKEFYTLMLTSATYRQAAIATPEKREKDRDNRLLSRGPRFRMDAEMIRDYALEASGLLVDKIGGPSVRPYQPDGVWEAVAMPGSDTRNYKQDTGDKLYRRSLYTFWKRAAPPAQMDILNAPAREICTVKRERTNTPLQALVTLNDPQFVEAARHLAALTLKSGGADDAAKVAFVGQRLLARSFHPEEAKVVSDSLAALTTHYKGKPEEAKKLINVGDSKPDATLDPTALAAWTMLCNQLMNLDEVLCK